MNWLHRAEARFGHFALPGLPRVIVAFNALVFVLYKLNPGFLEWLTLDRTRILHGEVWRLVTFLFIPSFGSILGEWLTVLLYLMFLWFVGNGLEQAMGAFRLNVFYLLGMIGTTIAAFFFGANFSNAMLNSSMFFAFARFFPDLMIYVFFILPVKVKWLAWISGALLLLEFVGGGWDFRMAVVAALANYLLFFGADIVRDARHRSDVAVRRRRFERDAKVDANEPLHCCTNCGRTELVAPDLNFRVARDGNEYCLEHLPKVAEREA